jgi:DNA-directed RNA polymerase specialized sigma subunit
MKNKNKLIKQLEELKQDCVYLEEMKGFMETEDLSLTKIYTNLRHMKELDLNVGNLDERIKHVLEEFVKSEKRVIKALEKRQLMLTRIDTMDQPFKNVLYFRYVCMKTFDEVAMKMNYSTKRIYQLHQKALDIYCDRYQDLVSDE